MKKIRLKELTNMTIRPEFEMNAELVKALEDMRENATVRPDAKHSLWSSLNKDTFYQTHDVQVGVVDGRFVIAVYVGKYTGIDEMEALPNRDLFTRSNDKIWQDEETLIETPCYKAVFPLDEVENVAYLYSEIVRRVFHVCGDIEYHANIF